MEIDLYEVLVAAKKGESRAKEYIIEKYQPMIINRSRSYFIRGYETEDLIQIASFTTLIAIDKYDLSSKGNFTSYLDRAIKNNFNNMLRVVMKTKFEASLDIKIGVDIDLLDVLASDKLTDDEVIKNSLKRELIDLLSGMSKDDLELLRFLYFENKSISEWSRKTGTKYYLVRKRRDFILNWIRTHLE
ncbi:sigma-70 family RNA polymerase sigma factor [uncultured Clostridium sp.]|jgi:RNA polymerase sigma factor (sigma-70 family)|uniref:sigma-70 family RNA polymerase sigma factor n=1 Tax=uncultured Clostridium sp. TaxID=59620 RepID=UPI00261468E7|nr:sigma-70 family RNA polymerase sigma factor [uncultured Clostridium sp.]